MTAREAASSRQSGNFNDPAYVRQRLADLEPGFYCLLPLTVAVMRAAADAVESKQYTARIERNELRVGRKAKPTPFQQNVVAALAPLAIIGPGGDFTRAIPEDRDALVEAHNAETDAWMGNTPEPIAGFCPPVMKGLDRHHLKDPTAHIGDDGLPTGKLVRCCSRCAFKTTPVTRAWLDAQPD